MWTEYFKMVKVHRGRIVTQFHGEIDFSSDDIPIETCKKLYDPGFPYLELTKLGEMELYGIVEKTPVQLKQQTQRKERADIKSKG